MDKRWETDRFGSAWAVYPVGSRLSKDRIAYVYVISSSEGNPSDKITKANADLIAAAPELMELAVEVAAIAKIVSIFPDKLPYSIVEPILSLGETARAVISKAKGAV